MATYFKLWCIIGFVQVRSVNDIEFIPSSSTSSNKKMPLHYSVYTYITVQAYRLYWPIGYTSYITAQAYRIL